MYEHIPCVFFGAAVSAFITIWLYSRDKKTQKQQQQPEEENCVLTNENGNFIGMAKKSCLDCQHCYLHASESMACNYFALAAPNKKENWISCNAARRLDKVCGREAKHFQPKEIKGNTENE